jgi:hypothetical protein
MRGNKLAKRNQYDLYSPHEEEEEFAGATQEKAQIVYCLPSGKRVKKDVQKYEHAYLIESGALICPNCGKTGHTTGFCTALKST